MKSKLRITETEFRNYLLKNYIDPNTLEKVSDRDLWGREEFFDYTGMFGINRYSKERKIVSTGTISYWKTKLDVKEEDVYNFNFEILSKKYPTYEDWSRVNNKGYGRTKKTMAEDTIKRKLVAYMGFPNSYKNKPMSYVQDVAYETFRSLGVDPDEEMVLFYRSLREGAR